MMLVSGRDPTNPIVWDPLFEGDDTELNKILEVGQILEANSEMYKRDAEGYALKFEGLNFLVMNRPGNSTAFKYIDDISYDGLMTWFFDGKNYIYRMYHGKNKESDLSKIAVKWGGGGHVGAAGYSSRYFIANPRDSRTTLEEFEASVSKIFLS